MKPSRIKASSALATVERALSVKAAARTREALWATIGDLLNHFPAEECQNYLGSCEYEPA